MQFADVGGGILIAIHLVMYCEWSDATGWGDVHLSGGLNVRLNKDQWTKLKDILAKVVPK